MNTALVTTAYISAPIRISLLLTRSVPVLKPLCLRLLPAFNDVVGEFGASDGGI